MYTTPSLLNVTDITFIHQEITPLLCWPWPREKHVRNPCSSSFENIVYWCAGKCGCLKKMTCAFLPAKQSLLIKNPGKYFPWGQRPQRPSGLRWRRRTKLTVWRFNPKQCFLLQKKSDSSKSACLHSACDDCCVLITNRSKQPTQRSNVAMGKILLKSASYTALLVVVQQKSNLHWLCVVDFIDIVIREPKNRWVWYTKKYGNVVRFVVGKKQIS